VPESLRIAVLIKQIPKFEAMALGPDGRLVRDGLELEMNAYCRRAVAKGVELARESGGTCTVLSLGPPSAEDSIREAVAWGADDGVLITDPEFAGSDTLATARALAAALTKEAEVGGPWDLILLGRNSVDADTGQVPPQLAQLLDLPFATGVRELERRGQSLWVRCEHDDEWVEKVVRLPALLSCAERLCDPAKRAPEDRAAVPADRIRRLHAGDLGPGPWGQHASPTTVGEIKIMEVDRLRLVLDGPVETQVARAVELLVERGALVDVDDDVIAERVRAPIDDPTPAIGVVLEPDRERISRELLGAAAGLANEIGGRVVAVGPEPTSAAELGGWGADAVIAIAGATVEEDVARAVWEWADEVQPWAVLGPSTPWGREVLSRVAASLEAGLTGDAVGLEVDEGRLLTWKPAFGGRTVAAIRASSPVQTATVRAGVLPLHEPRGVPAPPESVRRVEPRGRVEVVAHEREDNIDDLANARRVVGIGQAVDPDHYGDLDRLVQLLDAELAATRKVTDKGWLPRARQVGITGHSIAPQLYVAIGASGKFNHAVGVRQAGTILAINSDPEAFIFDHADIGIVGDWAEVVPELERQLSRVIG
jgi:electron transfer flavoprotein alpha subunit